MKTASLTYDSYLQISGLLRHQRCLTRAHDEMQFIIVHQVFELWFRLTLHEIDALRAALRRDDVPGALHLLARLQTILQALMPVFDVIETMRPVDFLEFRDILKPASGFQSLQFREIEFALGLKEPRYIGLFDGDAAAKKKLKSRAARPSIWDETVAALGRRGCRVSTEAELLNSIVKIFQQRRPSETGQLLESLVRYDELFAIWRQRHVTMTERMIGSRMGTGQKSFDKLVASGYSEMGQGGVDYLKTTLSKRFFPLLWQARTRVER
jgi:tryptophan 2,3-dioxygenase